MSQEEIGNAVQKKLPPPPEGFRPPPRLSEIIDAHGKFKENASAEKISSAAYAPHFGDTSTLTSESVQQMYSSSAIAPRSGPLEWASLFGIASSDGNAPPCVPVSDASYPDRSRNGIAPTIPSITGMNLKRPPSVMDASVPLNDALISVNALQGEMDTNSGVLDGRVAEAADRTSVSNKKSSKISKAAIANREGDRIALPRKNSKAKTSGSEGSGGKTNEHVTASSNKSTKRRRRKDTQSTYTEDRKKPATNKSRKGKASVEISPEAQLPWTPHYFANTHNPPLGFENTITLLPDTTSNFSIPPMSPSQLSNIYAPGDGENSIGLFTMDFSLSSPGTKGSSY